jgi:hypothetical protein
MPNRERMREEARRAQNRRLQERIERTRAAIRTWGHWGRELPPRHEERYLQIIYLDEMAQQNEKLLERQRNNNTRRRHEETSHFVSYNSPNRPKNKTNKTNTNKNSAIKSSNKTRKNNSNNVQKN